MMRVCSHCHKTSLSCAASLPGLRFSRRHLVIVGSFRRQSICLCFRNAAIGIITSSGPDMSKTRKKTQERVHRV